MSGIVSRLSVLGKVWLGLAAGALALIVFGLAAPGSSLFFPLVSLWCNAALFALALLVLRRAGVELDLFHKAVLVGLWAAAVLYFYWTLGSRTFLYHWDYVNYILKQYHAEAAFAQSTGAGFRFLLDSITEDYTNFITLFTEFPFCLSGKTGDDYAFCQVFSVLPSLLVLLAAFLPQIPEIQTAILGLLQNLSPLHLHRQAWFGIFVTPFTLCRAAGLFCIKL